MGLSPEEAFRRQKERFKELPPELQELLKTGCCGFSCCGSINLSQIKETSATVKRISEETAQQNW